MKRPRVPINDAAADVLKEARSSARMEKELRASGTPVKGGYVLTGGQLQEYFRKKKLLPRR